ncbi:MAG TPA: hypothetical protein VL221_04020 [Bacteroidota bacterium]|nr:hypothetical protein [Bacteroidota bacterium]
MSQQTADKYSNYFSSAKSSLISANVSGAQAILQTVIASTIADSTLLLSPEAYALIRFNTQYLIAQLQPSLQVKGGVFNPSGTSTLSVRAKADSNFTGTDTLIALTATIRWQSRYSAISLGTVSSPNYGFTASGSVVTQGNYKYQTFKTTTHVPLNWTAGTEYELFTVPVNGSAGVEDFTLTNALSGGQWFVDIDYLDKTDSVFYQPVATCTGLTSQNKADNWGPTAYSGERHMAITSTKLHEVYNSGGAIVYRRKSLTGGWEVTQRISPDSLGNNNDASILVAHDGSIHAVWQQLLPSNYYALYYSSSTDGGNTWRAAKRLAFSTDSIYVIFNQQWNIHPVFAELGSSQLVVACDYSGGMYYTKSTDLGNNWSPLASTGATNHGWYLWHPSLANIVTANCLILTYDARYNGVWSQKYNGTSWSSEAQVNLGTGTNSDAYSSIAFDWDLGNLYAAWSARISYLYNEYAILFRIGGFGNTWGGQFVQFPVVSGSGISDLYPSTTGWGPDNIDIIYNNTSNAVKLNQCVNGNWQTVGRVLSSSGYWTNTTLQEESGTPQYPVRVWTDQSANPYQVTLQTDGTYNLSKPQIQTQGAFDLHRRIVLESVRTGSTIWFDLGPLKVVTTSGDTVVVPFKKLSFKSPLTATLSNAWDYLGTDSIALPGNAKSLLLDAQISSQARKDSLGTSGTNVFTVSSFRVDGIKGTQTIPLLATQPSATGSKVVDVSGQAGQSIILRMTGTAPVTATEPVTIGVGDVYVTRKQ